MVEMEQTEGIFVVDVKMTFLDEFKEKFLASASASLDQIQQIQYFKREKKTHIVPWGWWDLLGVIAKC